MFKKQALCFGKKEHAVAQRVGMAKPEPLQGNLQDKSLRCVDEKTGFAYEIKRP